MKKYLVLSFTNDVKYASVDFQTDSAEDASIYSDLMSRNSDKKFLICSVC